MLKRNREITINPTVKEVAEEFCNMDADDQAQFFNLIDEISSKWDRALCFQLQSVTDSKWLTTGGRNIMEIIGVYSDKSTDR